MHHIQAIGLHIQGAACVFFADHIHVTLQNNRVMILITASTILEDDHIVNFVLNIAQISCLGKVNQIITDCLCVPGAVGDSTDFFKKSKYRSRI